MWFYLAGPRAQLALWTVKVADPYSSRTTSMSKPHVSCVIIVSKFIPEIAVIQRKVFLNYSSAHFRLKKNQWAHSFCGF